MKMKNIIEFIEQEKNFIFSSLRSKIDFELKKFSIYLKCQNN